MKGDWVYIYNEDWFRASLLPGGKHHEHIVEGGAWRRHRDMWLARRDGDTVALERLDAEQKQSTNEILPRFEKLLRRERT